VAETAEFVPIKETKEILRMEQHIETFWTLLKILICEDVSLAFRSSKEKWRTSELSSVSFDNQVIYSSLFFIYLKEKKVNFSACDI